jgi:Tol biopolymer transport system component
MLNYILEMIKEFTIEILVALIIFSPLIVKKLLRKLINKQQLKSLATIWAPGNKKVCIIISQNGKLTMKLFNVKTDKETKLNISIAKDQIPVWSPDGKKIAFVSDKDGNNEIYIVSADGTKLTRLTNDPAEDICPQWSPDSKKITFFTRMNGSIKIKTIDITKTTQN